MLLATSACDDERLSPPACDDKRLSPPACDDKRLSPQACDDKRLSPRDSAATEPKPEPDRANTAARPDTAVPVARKRLQLGIQSVMHEQREQKRADRKSSVMMTTRAQTRRLSVYARMESTIQRQVPIGSRTTARQMALMLRRMVEVNRVQYRMACA